MNQRVGNSAGTNVEVPMCALRIVDGVEFYDHGSLLSWSNAKAAKSRKYGVLNGVMYLAPHKLAGITVDRTGQPVTRRPDDGWTGLRTLNLCPDATPECIKACLNTSGHGAFSNVQAARVNRTLYWYHARSHFIDRLCRAIEAGCRKAAKEGLPTVAIRLDGTSDTRPEQWFGFGRMGWLQDWAQRELGIELRFYDYTKARLSDRQYKPGLYDLTYSYTGRTNSVRRAYNYLTAGLPVAVVFRDRALVERLLRFGYWGLGGYAWPVVDGDEHDLRFGEGAVIAALYAKGRARKQQSVFIQNYVNDGENHLRAFGRRVHWRGE